MKMKNILVSFMNTHFIYIVKCVFQENRCSAKTLIALQNNIDAPFQYIQLLNYHPSTSLDWIVLLEKKSSKGHC